MARQVIMVNNSVINIVRAPQRSVSIPQTVSVPQKQVVHYVQPVQGNHPLVPVLNVIQAANTFNTTVKNVQSIIPMLSQIVSIFR